MKPKIVYVWLTGYTDGYTDTYSNVGYLNESDAKEAIRPAGGYGRIKTVPSIKVGDEYYQIVENGPIDMGGTRTERLKKLKETALSKLSQEEREVLGLDKN